MGYKEWDVTQLISIWVSDPQQNNGLLIKGPDTIASEAGRTFTSSDHTNPAQRPELVITYSGGAQTYHRVDANRNCVMEMDEIIFYIDDWHSDSTTYPMNPLIDALDINYNRAGNAC